jgi:hypothetical protein
MANKRKQLNPNKVSKIVKAELLKQRKLKTIIARALKERDMKQQILSEKSEPLRKGNLGNRFDFNSHGGGVSHIRDVGVIEKR